MPGLCQTCFVCLFFIYLFIFFLKQTRTKHIKPPTQLTKWPDKAEHVDLKVCVCVCWGEINGRGVSSEGNKEA